MLCCVWSWGQIMYEKVKILQPILDAAVNAAEMRWPTYDGKTLDRRAYVSASEIGKCARMIWFSKNLTLEGGKFYWGYAQRGHAHEAWIVEQLRAFEHEYGWNYIGDEQVSFYDGYQSGTPDGVFSKENFWGLTDFKSIDPRKKVTALPDPVHIKQVVQNMDLVEHCLDVEFDGALLAYSNASDYSIVHEFWIPRKSPQVGEMMIQLEDRAEYIMNAKSAEEIEPEGLYTGDCTNCPFKAECSGAIQQKKNEVKRNDEIGKKAARVFG